jgi:phage terminase small subunit
MPSRKPASLSKRHDTAKDRKARTAAESAVKPRTGITVKHPDELKGHRSAIATWKRTVSLYAEVEGTIITAFDRDLLVKYCLLEEELLELAAVRKEIKQDYTTQVKRARRFKPTSKEIKDYVAMWTAVNGLFMRFQGMDARLDGKRKLLHILAQSLYLTPRARAGVAPPEKPITPPKSAMEGVLDGD